MPPGFLMNSRGTRVPFGVGPRDLGEVAVGGRRELADRPALMSASAAVVDHDRDRVGRARHVDQAPRGLRAFDAARLPGDRHPRQGSGRGTRRTSGSSRIALRLGARRGRHRQVTTGDPCHQVGGFRRRREVLVAFARSPRAESSSAAASSPGAPISAIVWETRSMPSRSMSTLVALLSDSTIIATARSCRDSSDPPSEKY